MSVNGLPSDVLAPIPKTADAGLEGHLRGTTSLSRCRPFARSGGLRNIAPFTAPGKKVEDGVEHGMQARCCGDDRRV